MTKQQYKAFTVIDNQTGKEAKISDFSPSWWHSKKNLKWFLEQNGALQIINTYGECEYVNADKITIVFNDGSTVNGDSTNIIKNEILNLLQKVLDLVKTL